MTKEELRDVIIDKIDEKSNEIEMNFARFKETKDAEYLRICTKAQGFSDGVRWLVEMMLKADII